MKLLSIVILVLSFSFSNCSTAQSSDKKVTTIILVRHAEKDTVGSNPDLSARGRLRAEKLPSLFPGLQPDIFYTTNYKRTMQTLQPWATQAGKELQLYSPSKQDDLADSLKVLEGKTIVITGHSNTIPAFVNLLIEGERFSNLADDDYAKVYVVTIKKGNAKIKVLKFEL